MPHESNGIILSATGQQVSLITRANLDHDGRPEVFDIEGHRIPWAEIPNEAYFPDLTIFEPTPEEQEQGALILANAALQRALRAAREVIWAACLDFDQDERIPSRTNHALARLDDALTSLESMSEVPDPDPVLTHAMADGFPGRLPWHVAMANGLMGSRRRKEDR